MGSGCVQFVRPLSECSTVIPSNCVQYQGPAVPLLGICTNDTITEVEQAVINKLLEVLNGTGITLDQVTLNNCAYLRDLFGSKDKTLVNLIQLLVDSNCSLKTILDDLSSRLQPSNFTFDLRCLGTISNPTIEKILQSLINSHCDLKTVVDTLIANTGNTTIIDSRINTALSNLITSTGNKGFVKTTDNTGLAHYHFTSLVPPLGAIMYTGPLTNFDADGLGLPGTPLEKWRLMNGKGGTVDMRGFVPVGQVQGVPGGALDPLVDPSANSDASMNYAFGSKGGAAKVTLLKSNLPNYTMTSSNVTINSVNTLPLYRKWGRMQSSDSRIYSIGNDTSGGDPAPFTLYSNGTGTVSIDLGGGNAPHENRMPYKAINWIVRID